jgi:hypothetical protein
VFLNNKGEEYLMGEEKQTYTPFEAGAKLIYSAVCIDEALADLVKAEVARIKKCLKEDMEKENLVELNKVLRNTISTMILTAEKIEAGITLLNYSKDNSKGEI